MPTNYIICNDSVVKYFIEYMNTFEEYIPNTLSQILVNTTDIFDEILFVQNGNYATDSLLNKCKNIKIVNTEQLCHTPVIERVLNEIKHLSSRVGYNVQIIDYSKKNQEILASNGIISSVRPYISPIKEITTLSNLLKTTEKHYKIGFVGWINPRRKHILDILQFNKIDVLILQNFSDERDKQLSSCNALLNIHCEEYFNIFESIRCNRWLDSGMLVISEKSVDAPESKFLIELSYTELCSLNFLKYLDP